MALPRVSICLLTYKRAQLLPQTLDTLLAQEHGDFELIINDDRSPDHTEEVCREYARHDSRIRYYRNPQNLRYANNQNAAILRARCEHVAIVHDADLYRPQLLTRWTQALLDHPSAALVFNAAEYMNLAREVRGTYWHPYAPLTPGRQMFDEMLVSPSSPIFGITMVRRSRVLEVGPFDPRLPTLADVDMWLRLLLKYDVAYVREPLYTIATREADHHNTYRNWRVRREAELIYELNWRRRYAADLEHAEPVRRRVAKMLNQLRRQHLLACVRHLQLASLRDGLKYIATEPPFGARLLSDSATSWEQQAQTCGLKAPSDRTRADAPQADD